MKKVALFSLVVLFAGLQACTRGKLYDETIDLKDYAWPVKQTPSFTFQVEDTAKIYDLYINLRNASAYPYNNLYVRHYLYSPDAKLLNTGLHNLPISDVVTGEPTGSGMGDIYDHSIRFIRRVRFTRAGNYTLKLQQYMRHETLPGIMAVGLKITEAAEQAKP